jgi:hypothetical protein
MKMILKAVLLAATLALPMSANAMLLGRDINGGAVASGDSNKVFLYDTVLNITWLQDANYARTSGYCNSASNCGSTDGRMTWAQANTWAESLDYGDYSSGWRIAKNSPVNGTESGWDYRELNNGTADAGYNITSTFSELAYMYYVNLGLKGAYGPSGTYQSDYGIFGNGTQGGQRDVVGPVKNLRSSLYWSGTLYPPAPEDSAWYFETTTGSQGNLYGLGNAHYAWAVRDGDVLVSAVPVPETYALMLAGLAVVGAAAKRRKAH